MYYGVYLYFEDVTAHVHASRRRYQRSVGDIGGAGVLRTVFPSIPGFEVRVNLV